VIVLFDLNQTTMTLLSLEKIMHFNLLLCFDDFCVTNFIFIIAFIFNFILYFVNIDLSIGLQYKKGNVT